MSYKYKAPVPFDGFISQVTIDVSQFIEDARLAIWSIYTPTGQPIEGAVAPISQTSVQITILPAPIQGDYQLVGLQ